MFMLLRGKVSGIYATAHIYRERHEYNTTEATMSPVACDDRAY